MEGREGVGRYDVLRRAAAAVGRGDPRVVCDFGGVLTTPLAGSFAAFRTSGGRRRLEALGRAMVGAIVARDGAHPLFELECGRLTEAEFLARLERRLREELGREVSLRGLRRALCGRASRPTSR